MDDGDKVSSVVPRSTLKRRLIIAAVVVAAIGLLYFFFGKYLSLEHLAEKEEVLRRQWKEHAALVLGIAFFVYVLVTGLSLPGAAGMSLVYGWLLGFWPGVLVVSFASTAGATIAFLLSRYFFREAVQARFGGRLNGFNAALDRDGAFYLLSLRLIPAVPFFVVNLVMGLTPIRTRTFAWVSQLGMLPGTCVYIFAGSRLPGLRQLADQGVREILTWQIAAAFVLLATFTLVVRFLHARRRF